MTEIAFKPSETQSDYANCIQVRTLVFVEGQGWPLEYHIDQHEADCRHILGMEGQKPCAALRWRIFQEGVAKIERVAVLEAWRGKGIGLALMQIAIDDIAATAPQCTSILIEAQDTVIPFYEKLGFKVYGDGFTEIGFPMHRMKKTI
ncbi:MAG: GNAT family N-acetyltransferase [Proteobacteria bacterium]|nr:GNAT family N-acetyltransferase [Pseudomonadota bacterium]